MTPNERKCSHQILDELLDAYTADRNAFLMERGRTYYKKWGRGIILLELSEAAFARESGADEMPAPVHYHYLSGDRLDGIPEEDRAIINTYDPQKECLVVGRLALDGAEPEFAVRTVKALSPFYEMLQEKGAEMRELAKSEYRKQGRGLLLFLESPPELAGMGEGYGAMYVTRKSGHPIFDDDPDAVLLVDGYDPKREFCYAAFEQNGVSCIGRATFDGKEGTKIAGFSDHEDTAHYGIGRFADAPAKPTAHDAIFGAKPKKERHH
jgi:hypothetical protein